MAWVSWASDGPVPYWFNVAQEFTERWVHQQQMREAVDRVADHESMLPEVPRTFVWAFPRQLPTDVGASTPRVRAPVRTSRWVRRDVCRASPCSGMRSSCTHGHHTAHMPSKKCRASRHGVGNGR